MLWLWFWLREDSEQPEPRKLILLAFFAGMASVTIAVPLEQFVQPFLPTLAWQYGTWAFVEEIIKFIAALLTVLWRDEDDEPIDALIYMVVVALGFAAAENTLFLSSPIAGSTLGALVVTSNMRFMGSTLLHVLASGIIGATLGMVYYRSTRTKIIAGFAGLLVAGSLHAFFNIRILTEHSTVLWTFVVLWSLIIALFAVIEWIKRLRPVDSEKNVVQ